MLTVFLSSEVCNNHEKESYFAYLTWNFRYNGLGSQLTIIILLSILVTIPIVIWAIIKGSHLLQQEINEHDEMFWNSIIYSQKCL